MKKIIATDLDRTLLPNGEWKKDDEAIPLFNKLVRKDKNLILIYVTGRSLKLTKNAIDEYGICFPDVLIGDVGTTIRYYKNNNWVKVKSWNNFVYENSPKWNVEKIKLKLSKIEGLESQEKSTLNEFKQSYYIEDDKRDVVLKKVEKLIKGKFDEEIVYSYDPLKKIGLLDILPRFATKKGALLHMIDKLKVDMEDVVYCGDSGNDILPLSSGVNAVIVKNGKKEVVDKVKFNLKSKKIQNKLYVAKGSFKKLNGNYTSGVIEGCYHFNFFKF